MALESPAAEPFTKPSPSSIQPGCRACEQIPRDPQFANISCVLTTIALKTNAIGSITATLLKKSNMDPTRMWEQCQAFDAAHAPGTKLNKVENYLANESFPAEFQARIDSADWVLYVDEVYVEPSCRGAGLSLVALDLLIEELRVGERCVVLLQAGVIGRFEADESGNGVGAAEAGEKIARHWKRMGFREWSDSDDAWLCLWSGARPLIHDVLSGIPGKSG